MTRINPINSKQVITINLATSHINDYARVASAARRLSKSSYHRYGSTIDFYVPNLYVDRFIKNSGHLGLDAII